MSTVIRANLFPTATPTLPQAHPCVIVIFGVTGDLSRRKLIPALFRLGCLGCTANQFIVLGVGRDQLTDDNFRARIRTAVSQSKEIGEFRDEDWQHFAPRLRYLSGDIEDANAYTQLAARLEELKTEGASTNRIFYLSTPPSLAPRIVEGLGAAGLADEDEGWSRIVVEKPFGRDLTSARELNEIIARVFREEQVYRIDHYLGRETVRNILVFRFDNSLFEPVWSRN